MHAKLKTPLLLIVAVIMVLAMIRLGFWQLDRAGQKSALYQQQVDRSESAAVPLGDVDIDGLSWQKLRYTNVEVIGRYLNDSSIFIDNQVLAGQVGYQVFTAFLPVASQQAVMVNRGWISVGESREQLPVVATPAVPVKLVGRLNFPPAQPPLWSDDYPVAQGKVWAYLPLSEYASQMQFDVSPLVLELAPDQSTDAQLTVAWSGVKQDGAAKHKAYALQWFAMAAAFVVLCIVLLVRTRAK